MAQTWKLKAAPLEAAVALMQVLPPGTMSVTTLEGAESSMIQWADSQLVLCGASA